MEVHWLAIIWSECTVVSLCSTLSYQVEGNILGGLKQIYRMTVLVLKLVNLQ